MPVLCQVSSFVHGRTLLIAGGIHLCFYAHMFPEPPLAASSGMQIVSIPYEQHYVGPV